MRRKRLQSSEATVHWTGFNPRQQEYVFSEAPFLMGSGGKGSGKTVALVRRAILLSTEFNGVDMSGNVGVIGRLAKLDFENTTYLELKRWLPPAWVASEDKRRSVIELVNGSMIYYTHYDDMDHILSMNLGWAALDQAEQIPWEVFEELALRRVRLKTFNRYDHQGSLITPEYDDEGICHDPDPRVQAAILRYHTVFGVCNPSKACKWIKNKFVENENCRVSEDREEQARHDPEFQLVYIPTTENRRNLPEGYIERQKRLLSEKEFDREVGGKWGKPEGLVYEDFSRANVHSVNFVPLPDWKIVVVFDHGGSGTPQQNNATNIKCVLFMAYTRRGGQWPRAILYDSLYLPGVTIAECVTQVESRLRLHQTMRLKRFPWYKSNDERIPVEQWRCDPAMAKGLEDTDESIMEAYMRHAMTLGMNMPLTPGNNDVDAGVQRANWMFREGLLTVNPWNTEGIKELEEVEYGDNGKIKPLQADHFCDCTRMGVLSIDFNVEEAPHDVAPATYEKLAGLGFDEESEFISDEVYGFYHRNNYSEEPL